MVVTLLLVASLLAPVLVEPGAGAAFLVSLLGGGGGGSGSTGGSKGHRGT